MMLRLLPRHQEAGDAPEYALMLTGPGPPPEVAPGRGELGARELKLVTLAAWGRTDAQIADGLHISIRTVRSHLDRSGTRPAAAART